MSNPISGAPVAGGSSAAKTPLSGRTVTWTSSVPAVCAAPANGTTDANGTVSPTLTMLAAGTTNLQATCGGKTSNVVVVVATAQAAVSTVTASPTSLSGLVGSSGVLSAVVKDGSSTVLTGRTVTWSTSNAAVVGWSGGTGSTLTANYLTAGTANVQAWCEGVGSNVVAVTVSASAAPVATVTVSPTSLSGTVGGSATLQATCLDASGNVLAGRTVTWASSTPTVASVTSPGQSATVTYLAPGGASITASAEGINSPPLGVSVAAAPTSTLFPNLPGTLTSPAGFSRDFNADPEGVWAVSGGGFATIRNASTYSPAGVTAPRNPPASPNNIGEAAYPAGQYGGQAPVFTYIPSATMGGQGWTRLYVAIWVQFSSNWWGNASGVNKIIYVTTTRGNEFYLSATGSGSGNLFFQSRLQNAPPALNGGSGAINLANSTNISVTRGLWQRVELLFTMNTSVAASDGQLKMWVSNYNSSGALVSGPTLSCSFSNIGWTDTAPLTWKGTQWTPVYGGGVDTIPAAQYMWMDKIYVAGK